MHTLLFILASALSAWSQWHAVGPVHFFARLHFAQRLSPVESAAFPRFGGPTTYQHDHHFGRMIFDCAADSVALTAFLKAIQRTHPKPDLDTTTVVCRAVWRIGERGGLAVVSRDDGSLMQFEGPLLIGYFMHLPFRMADGRRGFMVVHDTPCGLICRDTVYYVEDR